MIHSSLAAASLALLAAAPASGQNRPDRNCTDDRLVDRCSAEQQRAMRGLYGVPSIEEHSAAGEEVRRIFYVDGYGRDLILIVFVRSPRRDPELRIHYPMREGAPRPEPLRAAVPQPVWNEVAERGVHFDRSFAPGPAEEPSICLHSWVFTIEAAEPTRDPRAPVEVRRKVEDACEDGPAKVYAREFARLALPLVPHCAALDSEQHRNEPAILDACRILHGDRLAAAEVMNRARAFRQLGRLHDAERIAGHFAQQPQIDWDGQTYRGPGYRAGEFWAARAVRADGGPTNMYIERVEGESGSRVRLRGLLSRSVDTPSGTATGVETATIEQIWARDVNGTMMIERATIGPWRTRPE